MFYSYHCDFCGMRNSFPVLANSNSCYCHYCGKNPQGNLKESEKENSIEVYVAIYHGVDDFDISRCPKEIEKMAKRFSENAKCGFTIVTRRI